MARTISASLQRPRPVSGSEVRFGATMGIFSSRMSPHPSVPGFGVAGSSELSAAWHQKQRATPWARYAPRAADAGGPLLAPLATRTSSATAAWLRLVAQLQPELDL